MDGFAQAQKGKMMSDLISRQAAIEALDKRFDSIPMEQTTEILLLRKDLRELPSVQPERINGLWIEHDDGITACECSVCHEKYNLYEEDVFGRNFCPNCGADMREVTE